MNLVSFVVFKWAVTVAVLSVCGPWFFYDALKLWWLRSADRADFVVRDKHFGYAMGVVINGIGLIGVLRYHGVL